MEGTVPCLQGEDQRVIHPMAIRIGTTKQLFLDDFIISRKRNVERRLHRPVRACAQPVVCADQIWERGVAGVDIAGGTVLFDREDRVFKMWYRTNQALLEQAPDGSLHEATRAAYLACYAVSRDGLSWEKPKLALSEFQGSRDNNILPPGKGGRSFIRRPNVIKDYDEPDPQKRYKMVYLDEIEHGFVLVTAYSPDGINWAMAADRPTTFRRPVIPNGVLFGWDPRLRQYVLYHRNATMAPADVDGRQARSDLRRVVRSESPDFAAWGHTKVALALGRNDPANMDVGHLGVLSAILYTDDLYVGFVDTCTVHSVEDVPESLWESVYKMDHAEHRQELVISRDGRKWTRISPHWEFMRPGFSGSWDANHVILSKPLVLNDKIWIYYSGHSLSCKSYLPNNPDYSKINSSAPEIIFGYAIGLATMRLDGFVSLESYQNSGWIETKPFTFEGRQLVINARAPREPFRTAAEIVEFQGDRMTIRKKPSNEPPSSEPFGTVQVEITSEDGQALAGFTRDDHDVFSGDALRYIATWRGKSDVTALAGTPIRLKFYLKNAAVYAFQFTGQDGAAPLFDPACPGCRGRFAG